MVLSTSEGSLTAIVLASWLSCCLGLQAPAPSHIANAHNATGSLPFYDTDPLNHTIGQFISGFIDHAIRTSPYNTTLTSIIDAFEPTTGRSSEALYLASFLKIAWQFVNGIAKPFLKTYLVPIQMLFTYMAPKMFLRDCFNVDTAALLSARKLSPFTIGPAAQAFFVCAVDIIAQVILCVKLLANMATSIF